jgi:4-amino-4-deoxy-L-arabinose transferase-like glycosyltransferase
MLWRRREQFRARLTLAGMLAATAAWSYLLLDRTPSWHPWLRYAILMAGVAGVAAIVVGRRLRQSLRPALATAGLLAALAGPAAYTLSAVATAQTGANPTAGPSLSSERGFPGGGFTASSRGGRGPGAADSVSRGLAALLSRGSSGFTWVAASSSAQSAASLELASGKSVMALGGFSGNDPAITLSVFKQLVAERKVHYYVAGGGPMGQGSFRPPVGAPFGFGPPGGGLPPPGGGPPGGGPAGGSGRGAQSQIQSWVSSHFKSIKVGGMTVYDLTQAKA